MNNYDVISLLISLNVLNRGSHWGGGGRLEVISRAKLNKLTLDHPKTI